MVMVTLMSRRTNQAVSTAQLSSVPLRRKDEIRDECFTHVVRPLAVASAISFNGLKKVAAMIAKIVPKTL